MRGKGSLDAGPLACTRSVLMDVALSFHSSRYMDISVAGVHEFMSRHAGPEQLERALARAFARWLSQRVKSLCDLFMSVDNDNDGMVSSLPLLSSQL